LFMYSLLHLNFFLLLLCIFGVSARRKFINFDCFFL
jgi:hypothetical protein